MTQTCHPLPDRAPSAFALAALALILGVAIAWLAHPSAPPASRPDTTTSSAPLEDWHGNVRSSRNGG